MRLVNMRDLLNHAYENNHAVDAFDTVSLEFFRRRYRCSRTLN